MHLLIDRRKNFRVIFKLAGGITCVILLTTDQGITLLVASASMGLQKAGHYSLAVGHGAVGSPK